MVCCLPPLRAAAALFCFALPVAAATSPTAIVGHIFNPATQEYVRNAEIQVQGTDLVAYSESDGSYRLGDVPPGEVTLVVVYTGYDRATATLRVTPGQTATRDFEIKGMVYQPGAAKAPDAGTGASAAPVVLGEFVVSDEREGNAKALMEQRAGLNIKSIVAADNFGDVTGGNVGEFIKYLPGIVMDGGAEPSTARINGLDASNVGVSIDGMNVASAGAANFDGGSRNFLFEQASIYGVESIEISKTSTASMDADTPGGRINLRSRNAFDRRGRELTAQLTLSANLHAFTFKKTPGPYEGSDYKIRPGFVFSYSESFRKRFGVQLSFGASTVYTDQAEVTNLFNYAANRGPLINQINFRDAPKLTERSSFKLRTDYKISPSLIVSFTTSGAHLDDGFNNRQAILFVNPAQIAAGSDLTRITANRTNNANTRLRLTSSRRNKLNDTISHSPVVEYKRGDLTLTASGTFSRSRSALEDFRGGFFTGVTSQVTRMSWTAVRPDTRSLAWHIEQTSGRPWNDPASYLRDDAFANNAITNPQSSVNQLWVGAFDAKKSVRPGLPVQLGAGWKTKLSTYDVGRSGNIEWTYVGPTNNQLAPSSQLPTFTAIGFDPRHGGNVPGIDIPRPDPYTLFDLYNANPSHFRSDTVGNHIARNYSSRSIKEQIDSLYLEANTRWRRVRLNAGVRYERARTTGKFYDLVPVERVRAAGFTANTIAFTDYQYNYGERSKRYGSSERPFFSGGARYALTQNTHLRFAASQSIGRPSMNNLAGIIEVDETARRVRVPNPELKPRESNKYYLTLEHHLEPAGTLSLSGFKLFVENMGTAYVDVDPATIGYADDPEYIGYRFQQVINGNARRRIDGLELEYSQQLVFLPGFWRGFSVFGSLARTAADAEVLDHVPKTANGGIRFSNQKFNAQLRGVWTSSRLDFRDAPQNEEVWLYERTVFDFSGAYRLSRRFEITLTGRNILNSPIARYSNVTSHLSSRLLFGPAWTLGVRGRF